MMIMLRVVTMILAGSLAIVLLWEASRVARAYRIEHQTFSPPRGVVPMPLDSAALHLERVQFKGPEGVSIAAWYAPTRNGSGILLAHGSGATRDAMLDDARLLARDGHGLLLFDFPGHGESGGRVTLAQQPAATVDSAVAFLARQPGIDPDRIGALGFSFGGVAVAAAAAHDTRIRATALVATPSDAYEQTMAQYRRAGWFAQQGALLVYRRAGIDLHTLRPVDVVASIAPRPLAVFGGLEDRAVPVDEARALYAAARPPKELVIVARGGHGEYARADTQYGVALRTFFAHALARSTHGVNSATGENPAQAPNDASGIVHGHV